MIIMMDKEKLILEMKKYFGSDKKRIKHALNVLEFAEDIMAREGGDRDVILAAAVLHDIGIPEAERKYHSNAGKYQMIEGPPVAREILNTLKVPEQIINEVCEIIGNHHIPGKIKTKNFEILYRADCLVNTKMYD